MRYLLIALLAVAAGGALWWLSAPRPAFSEAQAAALEQPGDAGRGEIVFNAAGCASCHASVGQKDRHHLGGGLALASPFGTFRVPNISPDRNDGIGHWRTIDLANALMSGVSPTGQHYYPALPYIFYAHMRMDDVRDLMTYLRTLPPVQGRQPPHELHFPVTIRRFVGLWKQLYLDRSPISNEADRSPAWNRGHYLVEALSHCAECHSSRNLIGGIKEKTRFTGGPDPEGVGYVPNITPAAIGEWSEAALVQTLTYGITPAGHVLGSTMNDVVNDFAALPTEDRTAVASYIKSLPPGPSRPP